MSGTSLDGVDLALCRFNPTTVLAATTVPYPAQWRERLSSLENASALEYVNADVELGHYFGKIINDFLKEKNIKVDAIASHGHTIFHQPSHKDATAGNTSIIGFTSQIGDGNAIVAETGIPVIYNFRTLDVALGGQGAPLVPIGDELLFGEYDACLNLGGIANISYRSNSKRVAYDICPCNMALNRLASRLGLEYDPDGENARKGIFNQQLNKTLDNIDYYITNPPKSLGKEWFLSDFWPFVEGSELTPCDLLATTTLHIAGQIARVIKSQHIGTLLITGGGAHNRYLIESIQARVPEVAITVPDPLTVNYKEALIFALLGYLRLTRQTNTLASVTGARCDSIGGNICGLISC